jgi:hypothetical protein
MAMTADAIPIAEPSQPPLEPQYLPDHDPAEYVALPVPPARPEAGPLTVEQRPTRPLAPAPSPISVIVDANGQFLAEDRLGAVYGVGPTPQAAVSDLYAALDRRLTLLRTHRAELHPGLLRELGALEHLFPGR